jgi:16S rRNA U1498 N3-methylase RsmE
MNYFIIFGCVVCGWAMLRMMGTERSQMLRDMEARLRREAKKAAEQSNADPAPAASPAGAAKTPPTQNAKH